MVIAIFVIQLSFGAELVLSGAYQGKDVFVQNPFNRSTSTFCTQAVYVNDRKVFDQPNVSAYKIDLSHLEINDLVIIRIVHSEGCKPRIVNPQVLQKTSDGFTFISSEADHNSLSWSAEGETGQGNYYIEQKAFEIDWHIIDTVADRGSGRLNTYTIPAPHQKGENSYRVSYHDEDNNINYMVEMAFTKGDKITFYPEIATTTITLSDTASYVITDFFGKEVKKGEGVEIFVNDLRPGEYYLNIQNRKERFVKK